MNVQQCITAVKRDLGAVGKGNTMKDGPRYNYRSIDDVLNKLHDGLCEHGVIFAPRLIAVDQSKVGEGKQIKTIVQVDYIVTGPEGDSIVCGTPGEANDSGDKGVNKAMTAAFKVLLTQLLAIPFDTDDPDHHYTGSESASNGPRNPSSNGDTQPKSSNGDKGPTCEECGHAIGSDPVKVVKGKRYHAPCAPSPASAARAAVKKATSTPPAVEKVFPGTTEVNPDDYSGDPF